MLFRVDVFAWIPQPDVGNPLHSLPGGTARWGPGACGPRFGGDNMVTPAATHTGFSGTFRAKQSFGFTATSMGAMPIPTVNTGVLPGLTTVLTAPRASGGTVCHSLTATVKSSSASVSWVASESWYEVKIEGSAQDPVPAAMAASVAGAAAGPSVGSAAGTAASAATPVLAWDLLLRFQRGSSLGLSTRARYAAHSAAVIDVAARTFSTPPGFGGTGNLFHGLCTVRRFPSYIIYVTVQNTGAPVTIPVYFADASGRGLGEILVDWTDPFRQFAF